MRRERYSESDFNDFLQEAINSGLFSDTVSGIAKQVIDNGYDSLSDKQKDVFDKAIDSISTEECALCGLDIPWSEMIYAHENGCIAPYVSVRLKELNK